MNWSTPIYYVKENNIIVGSLADYEDRAMLPRELGVDFRYYVTEDSEGYFCVMKCLIQGARPIRIGRYEIEEEALLRAEYFNCSLAYEAAMEDGAWLFYEDAKEYLTQLLAEGI